MDRKQFLTKGAVLAGSASLLGACVPNSTDPEFSAPNIVTGKSLNWTMVTTWPPNLPVLQEGCKRLAEQVKLMSSGRLVIKVYGGNELVPPLETFENVRTGNVQMGSGAAYYWSGKTAAAQFFASVPFGLNAQQMNAWLVSGGGQALWEEVYAPFNVISFPAGNTGVQMGGWFNKEIKSLADFQGLKMRIPGLGGEVITRAGATAVNVPGQEIYTNLDLGVIDATEWIGPYHDYLMGFHNIAPYYYYPGWHEPGTTLEVLINKSAFEGLPADLQAILKAAIAQQNMWTLCEFEAKNAEYLARIRAERAQQDRPLQIRAYPTDLLQQLRQYTLEVVEELANSSPLSRKVYDAFMSYYRQAQTWSGYTEKVYFQHIQK